MDLNLKHNTNYPTPQANPSGLGIGYVPPLIPSPLHMFPKVYHWISISA